MIKIENLKIGVGNREILKGISLEFEKGKNYLVIGKNGSGKSSLANFLMGSPSYDYIDGKMKLINLEKEFNLIDLSPDERSKKGLFLSFQNIPEIEGIKLSEYLRVIYNISLKNKNPDFKNISPFIFNRYIKSFLEELDIPLEFLDRDLNVGFSGGEKRKIEILQMKLISPEYIILDEIDSGLDVNAFNDIFKNIKSISDENNSFIIITHQFKILDYLKFDKVFIMRDGKIVESGGIEVIEKIKEDGFE